MMGLFGEARAATALTDPVSFTSTDLDPMSDLSFAASRARSVSQIVMMNEATLSSRALAREPVRASTFSVYSIQYRQAS